jgi:TRAP-type C4-dicarboxylate transport system permease small subunit
MLRVLFFLLLFIKIFSIEGFNTPQGISEESKKFCKDI